MFWIIIAGIFLQPVLFAGKRIQEGWSVEDIEYLELYATYHEAEHCELNLSYQELDTLDGLNAKNLEHITHLVISHNFIIDLYALTKIKSNDLTHIHAEYNSIDDKNLIEELTQICQNFPYLKKLNLKNNLLRATTKRAAKNLARKHDIILQL